MAEFMINDSELETVAGGTMGAGGISFKLVIQVLNIKTVECHAIGSTSDELSRLRRNIANKYETTFDHVHMYMPDGHEVDYFNTIEEEGITPDTTLKVYIDDPALASKTR